VQLPLNLPELINCNVPFVGQRFDSMNIGMVATGNFTAGYALSAGIIFNRCAK
jgi:hypothetical protein